MRRAACPRTGPPGRTRGVALITALLVVALATAAAVAMSARQQLEVRRTANQLQVDQVYLYAVGIEGWVGQVLRRDREDGEVDSLDEDWATQLPPLPVEGGALAGRVEDLQGRFNLNNLVHSLGNPARDEPDLLQQARFRRLLEVLDLDPDLANAVTDWLDADLAPAFPGGAEDDRYLTRTRPYRAANAPMADASELLAIEGVTPEVYRRLSPFVVALPRGTKLNLNTAPPEVFRAVLGDLAPGGVESLLATREQGPFRSMEAFTKQEPLADHAFDVQGLGVGSDYFALYSTVRVGRIERAYTSVMHRDAKRGVRVVRRALREP